MKPAIVFLTVLLSVGQINTYSSAKDNNTEVTKDNYKFTNFIGGDLIVRFDSTFAEFNIGGLRIYRHPNARLNM